MNKEMQIEDQQLQASGYPRLMVLVHPDPGTYLHGVVCRPDTDDATAEIILDDILRKYSGAWSRLSEM